MHSLSGKVAIVTGGASGIGQATALTFAQHGAAVAIADLDLLGGQQVVKKIENAGGRACARQVDVTESASVDRAVEAAEERFGGVTTLSLNAGLTSWPTPAVEADEAEFERILMVNVKGAWLCARSAVPALRRSGGGSIIVTGSIMGERARPGFAAYAASKAAANHLAKVLALELAADGIRVNALAPLATETPMLERFLGRENPEKARQAFIDGVPMKRLAQPQDIADVAVFLASDAARFVTGVVIPVDGGRSI